ncbi:hypothetical protein HUU53_01355 [Candidatus Micrarchaeota archaeon]|nr:hypothetical protein [Candidatus Micrarchaeota archaeon]
MSRTKGQAGQPFMESAIPLILIVVLGLFIAARFGYLDLSSVPVVGNLLPGSRINVGVLGTPSEALLKELRSEDARIAGITYIAALPQEAVVKGSLKNFDIIIMQGEIFCDRTAREAVRDAVQGGKKLLLIGNACTRVHDDRTVYGWDFVLKDVVPVKLSNIQAHEIVGPESRSVNGRVRIISQDHPIFNGLQGLQFSGTVTSIFPTPNSDVLAYVDEYGNNPVGPAEFAIIESKGLLAGKTMYFAFDPGTMISSGKGGRNMFISTLLYLKKGNN